MAESYESTLTSKGQVTVPSRLRSALGLKSGDKLVFRLDEQGKVHVEARSASLGDLLGAVKNGPPGIDGDQVARWIKQSRGNRWQPAKR